MIQAPWALPIVRMVLNRPCSFRACSSFSSHVNLLSDMIFLQRPHPYPLAPPPLLNCNSGEGEGWPLGRGEGEVLLHPHHHFTALTALHRRKRLIEFFQLILVCHDG